METDSCRPCSLRETARLVDVSPRWLHDVAERGLVPSLRTDRGRLFNLDAVRRALSALAAASPDERRPEGARS